jgi:pyruvate dehydrogenase E1 component alpha subunit
MKALAFGMARDRFDGDDVVRVHARILEAVERARETSEPTMVEVKTYRFRGHSMSDPGQYRTKEEVEEWRKRDPVSIGRRRLIEEAEMDEPTLKALEVKVKAEIEDAVKFAEESPPADEYLNFTYKE